MENREYEELIFGLCWVLIECYSVRAKLENEIGLVYLALRDCFGEELAHKAANDCFFDIPDAKRQQMLRDVCKEKYNGVTKYVAETIAV